MYQFFGAFFGVLVCLGSWHYLVYWAAAREQRRNVARIAQAIAEARATGLTDRDIITSLGMDPSRLGLSSTKGDN